MAHTKSAKKMIRLMEGQRRRNKAVKSFVKTRISMAEELISGKEVEQAKDAVGKASLALDKAAKKGILHPNNAARRKSRLTKKLNAALSSTGSAK